MYPEEPRDWEEPINDGKKPEWREKRHSHREHRKSDEWLDKVKTYSDSDSSDEAENDPHLRWLKETVDDMDMGQRCEVFSVVAVLGALTYAACGVIFIVTGSLGVGAARTMVGHRQSGLVRIISLCFFRMQIAIYKGIVTLNIMKNVTVGMYITVQVIVIVYFKIM